MFVDIIKVVIL